MKWNQIGGFKNKMKWIVSVWILVVGIGSVNAQNMRIDTAVMSYPYADSFSSKTLTIKSSDWQTRLIIIRKNYNYLGQFIDSIIISSNIITIPGNHFAGYRFLWGDGEGDSVMGNDSSLYVGKNFLHTYLNAGTYPINTTIYYYDSIITRKYYGSDPNPHSTNISYASRHTNLNTVNKTVPQNPNPLHQTVSSTPSRLNDSHNRQWFDLPLSPLKFDSNQIRFFLDCNNVRDQYLGNPIKPFSVWDGAHSKEKMNNWTNWKELDTGKFRNTHYPVSCPYVAAIYKSGQDTLLGIVHLEQLITTSFDPPSTRIYSIGIAYSTDNGNNWTYCGDIIRPQAQKTDDTTTNPKNKYTVCGGPYIIKGDSIYIYYTDNATMTPPALPDIVGRVCIARAKLSQVLDSARINHTVCTWVKYNKDSSNIHIQQGLTGLGSPILPIPNIGYVLPNKAVYCKAIKRYLMLVGAYDNDSGWALRMYSSIDGITWPRFWRIDNAYVKYPTFPYLGDIGGYASFSALPNDPDATDDFHEVGKLFYVNYPKNPATTDPTRMTLNPDLLLSKGNLYYVKIIATPDISPAINLLLGD